MRIITVTLNPSVDRTVEVPGFAVGGHLRGRLVRVQPAGKGVNVSRVLARAGVPSVVAGLVGAREALLFRESFQRSRASVALVPIQGATRTNTTLLDPVGGTDTHVREAGPEVLPQELDVLRERLGELASEDALLVFCGSLPPAVTADSLGQLMAAAVQRDAAIAADLNGRELGVAVQAGARLIKPNVRELGELLGTHLVAEPEQELVRAARRVCDRVGTVLLTRGEKGALAITGKDALAGRVEVGSPRNTVGCGDAALAGYLAALARGAEVEECLRDAVAFGGASALAEAAGQLDWGEVMALRERAVVGSVA